MRTAVLVLALVACNKADTTDEGPSPSPSPSPSRDSQDPMTEGFDEACDFPMTVDAMDGAVWLCSAEDEAICRVRVASEDPCDTGTTSLHFQWTRGYNGASIAAANANGWAITDQTAGNPIANVQVNRLPWDEDVTVFGGGGGIDFEITFQVTEMPETVTIQELVRTPR